jgi:hypothetical protein
MKVGAIACAFLLIAGVCFGEGINGNFEIGKMIEEGWIRTEIRLGWETPIGPFRNELFGGIETYFNSEGTLLHPFRETYQVGDRVSLRKMYFEIDHRCGHPVFSSYNVKWSNDRRDWSLTTVSVGVGW